jgi:magnesium chelatase family protein
MTIASIDSRAILGMESPTVSVEVHVSNGLPALSLVGLPETSVKESRDRVRSALISSGFELPPKRITVNLAPADLPKAGGRYDLPIAIGILVATNQLKITNLTDYEAYGELGLSGEVRSISGSIASTLESLAAGKKAIVPRENSAEVELLLDTKPEIAGRIFLVNNLKEACKVLLDEFEPVRLDNRVHSLKPVFYHQDIGDVVGQQQAKRALEICASGEHSILLVGPPGAGKSMLASRLVTILPELSADEAIEVAKIRSISGVAVENEEFYCRPYMQPHHSASAAAIIGGGTYPKPGALSLSHKGVLFLDELPEFSRPVLEALREPLETKEVHVSRVNQHVTYPADHLLVAAMNPSPSGYFPDDPLGRCKDTPEQISRYQKRISGPLIDRIDLHLEVPAVEIKDLSAKKSGDHESSYDIRQRVRSVRDTQLNRQGCFNSNLLGDDLTEHCRLDSEGENLIEKAAKNLGLSARSYHKILRVARTVADMEDSQFIKAHHLAEALSYRATSKAFQ